MSKFFSLIFTIYLFQVSIVKSQEYTVGGDFDYAPFSFIDKTGIARGLDIDILNAISEETGLQLNYYLSEWEKALNYIQSGKIDIITGIIFSEEREKFVDFTYPIHTESYSVFIRKDLPFKEISDLYGYKLMVLNKDISIEKFLIPMGLYKNYIVAKSLPEALAGVEWGRADYVIAPNSLGMNEIEKNKYKNIEVKGPTIISSIYCLAVKKGNTQLLGILNKGISELRANGDLAKLQAKWLIYERDDFRYKRIAKTAGIVFIVVSALLTLAFMWVWSLRKQIRKKTKNINIKNQELKKLNTEKDKFLSIIAHDLRSPFNAIIGYSNILVEEVKTNNMDKVSKFSKIIRNSSQRAMDLLTNLMEWAQSETGRLKYNPEYILIYEIVNEMVLLFNDIAMQKSITIEKKTNIKAQVYADKAMISTVLRNLISNAIKYTPSKGKITISSEIVEQNKLLISVKDTGIGLPQTIIDELFQIERNLMPGTQNEKGTGLGLILCKEFIEKHKGEIWVESEPDKGSTFNFTIPYLTKDKKNQSN